MHRLLPLVLALLLLAACGDDSGSTQDTDEAFDPASTTTEVTLPDDAPTPPTDGPAPDIDDLPEGAVVFSPDEAETDVNGNETTWTPSVADVEGVDALLAEYAVDHPELELRDYDAYVRQYVGTGEVGETASVNALCEADDFDYQDELVLVEDGGSCFWQAEVSFFTLEVESFTVNGDA